ncbi:MAG: hypothetical protein Q8M94_05540 [Ignavibacteria bacterium]|nr:hypothetical protein [Ignavibacteria bacterium]
MSPKKIKNNKPEEVSSDIIYQELYQEMRRFRDYELSSSTWYTIILLAILSAIISVKYAGNLSLKDTIFENCTVKVVVLSVIFLIGFSSVWSAYYVRRRYQHLRNYVDYLEPEWHNYQPEIIFPAPYHLILLTQVVLILISILMIFF